MAMPDSYRVVLASPEHVSSLPDVERSAATLFANAVPEELLEHVTPESDFGDAQRDGMLWVALDPDDDPVGFVRVVVANARVHLAELDVLPAHGRRGIGTALVRTVQAWADSREFSEVTLTTYRDLPWNAPFYAQLGFTIVPESEWDADMRHRFDMEIGLESERTRRVVMHRRRDTA